MDFSFGCDFINQKVYIEFYLNEHEVFKDYLQDRSIKEVRTIEKELEKDLTDEYQILRFDDYSKLVYNNKDVHVYIQYPNDKEERADNASLSDFYELMVLYNYEYDFIAIDNRDRTISPKAQAIIDRTYNMKAQK